MIDSGLKDELVSIVVPVYKVEKYINQCVESLLRQTYSNIEIILVDDGSPDNCPRLCDDFKVIDSRVVVIHKKNGGLSSARNEGIKRANGKFITFVDSDDYVSEQFIERLYFIIKKYNCDIAQCYASTFTGDSVEYNSNFCDLTVCVCSGREMCERIFGENGIFIVQAQNKLYNIELFKDISFPEGKLHEDEFTTYKLFWNVDRIGISTMPLYYYRIDNADSIMHLEYDTRRLDGIDAIERRMEFFEENGSRRLYELSVYGYCMQLIGDILKIYDSNGDKGIAELLLKKAKDVAYKMILINSKTTSEKFVLFIKIKFFNQYYHLRRIIKGNSVKESRARPIYGHN